MPLDGCVLCHLKALNFIDGFVKRRHVSVDGISGPRCLYDFDDDVREAAYVAAPGVFDVLYRYVGIFLMAGEQDDDLGFVFCKRWLKHAGCPSNGLKDNIHYMSAHEKSKPTECN